MSALSAVIVAGHAICRQPSEPWEESNWILLPYQRGETGCYLAHIEAGVRAAARDAGALLVFSGGYSRQEAGPRSEAQSYYWIADALGWFGHPEVRARTITEEFARDSYENLLYSICRVREFSGQYPEKLSFVSWRFKEARFQFHRQCIRWPSGQFVYMGPNDPPELTQAAAAEARSLAAYREDPYSRSPAFRAKRDARNPFRRTASYPLSCPDVSELFAFEGPGLYAGSLPWMP